MTKKYIFFAAIAKSGRMGITKVDFEADGVRIAYHLGKPYGIPDEDGELLIPYDQIQSMKELPQDLSAFELGGYGSAWPEEVDIPKVGRKLALVFRKYPEKSYGPFEEDYCGMFLVPDSLPPRGKDSKPVSQPL